MKQPTERLMSLSSTHQQHLAEERIPSFDSTEQQFKKIAFKQQSLETARQSIMEVVSYRRRRKRQNKSPSCNSKVNGQKHRKFDRHQQPTLSPDEEYKFSFLGKEDDDDRPAVPFVKTKQIKNIVLLLHRRETVKSSTHARYAWRSSALLSPISKKSPRPHRRWKPTIARRIPFTQLGTPNSDAVLALDRWGSLLVCLGGQGETVSNLALAVNFYAVPSPANVHRSRLLQSQPSRPSQRAKASLLMTIPLLRNYDTDTEGIENDFFAEFQQRSISPASTPVQLLVSSDWRIGIALLVPESTWNEDSPPGTIIIFSVPSNADGSSVCQTFTCANVKIGQKNVFANRNLLWNIDILPVVSSTGSAAKPLSPIDFDSIAYREIPLHLLLNDEEDGFRMTWILGQWDCAEIGCEKAVDDHPSGNYHRAEGASIITQEHTWEVSFSDGRSGEFLPSATSSGELSVACEAFIHIDTLLDAILSKRKNIAERYPQYYYNAISVLERGRLLEVIITFTSTKLAESLGIFVSVDLLTGAFKERDWVRSAANQDCEAQRRWCNMLAVNRRMQQTRAGPFSVDAQQRKNWGCLCHEKPFDMDHTDDFQPRMWKACALGKEDAPKRITMASLYPDCDLITNRAVLKKLPVSSLSCQEAPVSLVYG